VPNLLIPSCIYNLNPVCRTTFGKLMRLMTQREYAQTLLLVYLPPGYHASQAQPLPAHVRIQGASASAIASVGGCRKDCLCKCPSGCLHCGQLGACRCQFEPVILALTRQERGKDELLLLHWCNAPDAIGQDGMSSLKARIHELLSAWQAGAGNASTGNGQLMPFLPYWQNTSARAIQAAFRMHLHKGLIEDAGLERQRLKRGELFCQV
jgi:hypothetical protein